VFGLVWKITRGYRLRPWDSPYLRWRIETYQGIPAHRVGFCEFWTFLWRSKRELWRYLRWARSMQRFARPG